MAKINKNDMTSRVSAAVDRAPTITSRLEKAKTLVGEHPLAHEASLGTTGVSHGRHIDLGGGAVREPIELPGKRIESLVEVDVHLIDENPFNARAVYRAERIAELASSIAAHGQDTPGIATMRDGRYVLAAGHYRLKSIKVAGLPTMKLLCHPDLSDQDLYAFSYRENKEREGQSAYDDALAWRGLLDKKIYPDQKTIAAVTKNSTGNVNKTLRILDLSSHLLELVAEAPDKYPLTALYELVLFEETVREHLEASPSEKERDRYDAMALEFIRKLREGQIGRDAIQAARISIAEQKPRAKKQTSRPYVIDRGGIKGKFKTWDSGRVLLDITVPEGPDREAIIAELKTKFGISD